MQARLTSLKTESGCVWRTISVCSLFNWHQNLTLIAYLVPPKVVQARESRATDNAYRMDIHSVA